MDYQQQYQLWLKNATDSDIKRSLASMSGNQEEIRNAFTGELQFGTAGLRGVMTAGTNRMNVYTVYRASEGLARYMDANQMTTCAITYDSRLNSQLFSKLTAATLASHGITVYITRQCMPTPFLSYLVRYYNCAIGVNVTASHNPASYNGYKVYDGTGGQIFGEAVDQITEQILQVQLFEKPLPRFEDYADTLIKFTSPLAEQSYVQCVLGEGLGDAKGLNVVYTPLNGAGYEIVPQVLRQSGVSNLEVVPPQSMPDGNFATCPYPNPEKPEALSLAMQMALHQQQDIVIANDPDCDRLGVAVMHQGQCVQLNGNEVGVLLCDYVLSQMQKVGKLPKDGVVVRTFVTSPMVDALCRKYGASVRCVLTGFKYVGDVATKLQNQGQGEKFVFGFEESCGYLKGNYVRDKDGVVASMLIAQCASFYKKRGLTLVDRLNQLYGEFGYYFLRTLIYRFDGVVGGQIKDKLLGKLRKDAPKKWGNSPICEVVDFLNQTTYDVPKDNTMRLIAQDGSQVIIRPSGTEPIVKCYVCVHGEREDCLQRFEKIKQDVDTLFAE